MADYVVDAGAVGVHRRVLAAGVADSVTFTDGWQAVEVVTDGAAELYVTIDGTVPVVGGSTAWLLPAVACAREINVNGGLALRAGLGPGYSTNPIKLVSDGTPTYSVMSL